MIHYITVLVNSIFFKEFCICFLIDFLAFMHPLSSVHHWNNLAETSVFIVIHHNEPLVTFTFVFFFIVAWQYSKQPKVTELKVTGC